MAGSRISPYRYVLVLISLFVANLYSSIDSRNLHAFGLDLAGSGAAQAAQPPSGPALRLRGGEVDPLAAPLPQINGLDRPALEPYAPALRLVQFDGPIQDKWLQSLTDAGLLIVTYIPDYAYLVWGTAGAVERLALSAPLRWRGEYQPDYALHPDLAPLAVGTAAAPGEKSPEMAAVIVQVVDRPETAGTVAAILQAAQAVIRPPSSVLAYRNFAVVMPVTRLAWLAAQPGVVNVAPYLEVQRHDEIQGQIMAGHLDGSGTGPGAPGYLAWLNSLSFSTNPDDYPIVDVTDDGIDDGDATPLHPDFYTQGNPALLDRLVYNYNWTSDSLADGRAGHGNLNASVVGGYNNQAGSLYRDPSGYQRGLGINPFGRLAGSKVFNNFGGWALYATYTALVSNSYSLGARITSNSWGATTYGDYTSADQEYDALVRDAMIAQTGNQEMVVVFSAGNSGFMGGSIGSPGNAKNVITVGASESYRPNLEPSSPSICGAAPDGSDTLQDVADFSSRGPTDDGRTKPDIVAPGTMILGAASKAPGYDGSGVCIRYYPTGQELYAASSGTSHAAPAVAGAASLLDYYYRTTYSAAEAPSPAMVKAYLVNTARYLTGAYAADSLPSMDQGFGLVDLGRAFDNTSRFLIDQQVTLAESGETYEMSGVIADPTQPLRITLAWTDAPGATIGAAYVNNLDLELEIGGETYYGNVFSGPSSHAGGGRDFRNNVESIFLPAGRTGAFTLRIQAANLPGDGLPGNDDPTDQDFALVVYNARSQVGELSGVVREQPANIELAGAVVRATSPSGRTLQAKVALDGAYSMTLWANIYTLQAWKYGYSLQTFSDVTIADGAVSAQDFDLSAVPSYTFHTCITDEVTRQGLAATVSILGPFGELLTTMNTSPAGECLTLSLPEGSYHVQVSSRLHYPAEADLNLIQNVRLDFPLPASTTDGLLYGQVSDQVTEQPLAGAALTLQPGSLQVHTAADGRFEIQAPPGVYTLTAAAALFEPISADVEILQSNLVESSFSLAAPRLELVAPAETRYALDPEDIVTLTVHLENTGAAPLRYSAYERAEGLVSAGGPQTGGYIYQDSLLTSEARYDWIDAGGGHILPLLDDGEVNIDLPFPFGFFGQVYDRLRIGNNGMAVFDPDYGDISYQNLGLSGLFSPLIAPFWDDLDDETGYVAYQTLGVAPERRLVIEWNDRPHYNNVGAASVQAILYEAGGNIKFQYQDVGFDNSAYDRGAGATIGLHGAGSALLELSYNTAARSDGSAVCFLAPGSAPCDRLDLPWLSVTPDAGTLAVGESVDLTVRIDAGLAPGAGYFPGGVRLFTTDPHAQPFVDVPTGLAVLPNPIYLPLAFR